MFKPRTPRASGVETVSIYLWVAPPIIHPIRMTSEVHLQLRRTHGLTRESVADVLQTGLQEEVISHVLPGQQRFDLLIRLEQRCRTTA